MQEFNYEEAVMGLIVNAGQCKSFSFSALQQVKKGNYSEAEKLMAQADEAAKRAHEMQTQLIGFDEGEGKVPVHLIMVHAQDHLMTSMLAKELIHEFIALYRQRSYANVA